MDIAQLKDKLSEINQMGYVVSLRKSNTGIGYTLETLLGLEENNLA
ncbi:MAG: MvaI/BcnI family restriction endonuclease [Candidatus Poribacteria bacterium]|nr:MvaI/BcnI family restriction endonuclease [Candidatus Poribacteria bacterium]